MAKRKGGLVRRVYVKARKAYRKASGGIPSLLKPVVGGAVYAVAFVGASMLPISGLPAIVKRGLTIAILWVAGGMKNCGFLRDAAKIGIGMEVFNFALPYISKMAQGIGVTAGAGTNSL